MTRRQFKAFRATIEDATQDAAVTLAHIRGAHKLACGNSPLHKLTERRAFALLQLAISFRDELAKLNEDLRD